MKPLNVYINASEPVRKKRRKGFMQARIPLHRSAMKRTLKNIFMPLKYHLVNMKNLGKDAQATPSKFYAQAVNNGYVTFEELCSDISENCTLTSADVKAVLDRMNWQLEKHLRAGRIVQFGEIGNFRMAVGSSGSETENGFQTSQIRKPKIIFHPGKRLQASREKTGFEKHEPGKVGQPVQPGQPATPTQPVIPTLPPFE